MADQAVLPEPRQLGDGLWMIPVPIPIRSLPYSLAYALEGDDGVYLLDTGWDMPEAMESLQHGLKVAGYDIADVRGVVATHSHPDHYGLADQVRRDSNAWLALHADESESVKRWATGRQAPDAARELASLRRLGLSRDEALAARSALASRHSFSPPAQPDRLLRDGDVLDLGGRRLEVIATPGHSPGHAAFHMPIERVLFSGDHILPSLTPALIDHQDVGGRPVDTFLSSLDRLEGFVVQTVLPGHEQPFESLDARVDDLRRHHSGRTELAAKALAGGSGTAWEMAMRVDWGWDWEAASWRRRHMAALEILTHLRALRDRGVAAATGDAIVYWHQEGAATGVTRHAD